MTAGSRTEAPTAAPALSLEGVVAGYDRRSPVLEDVTLTVPRGALVGLVGPNGSGKSTLFRVVLGLLRPRSGSVHTLGEPIERARRRVGYMPQVELVDWGFPVLVKDLVMMGRYPQMGPFRGPGREDRHVVDECLGHMGLSEVAQRQIGELSGGQQRRMLFARTLAQEPDLLLLDEPMTGLDATSQHAMLTHFEHLRDEGKTVIVATHDLSCVASCFDLAILLNRRLVALGPPSRVFTRDHLEATFGSHLLMIPAVEGLYVGHHEHG